MQRYVLGVLIFALLVAIFTIQNAGPVNLKVFFWVATVPLVIVILVTVLCGLLIGLALASFGKGKKSPRIPK